LVRQFFEDEDENWAAQAGARDDADVPCGDETAAFTKPGLIGRTRQTNDRDARVSLTGVSHRQRQFDRSAVRQRRVIVVRVHDTILRCRINAAFLSQVERRIYAAEAVPEEICPAPLLLEEPS